MTEKLYDERPYDTSFEAKVVSWESEETENGVIKKAVLDSTMFFPNQGGQTSDRGTLGDYIVENVTIENGIITHYLREEIKPDIYRLRDYDLGDTILGTVDWNHRFSNMQQHTGEHIFTGIAHNKYGVENVGFHLSDNVVTLDLDKFLTDEQIEEIEIAANDAIASNVPIKVFYPSKGELDFLDYRCKDGIEGEIRLVEIEGVDLCACCAPHVSTTGQVGVLKVIRHEKYKGGIRIWILCGARALKQWQEDKSVIDGLVKEMTCQPADLLGIIRELKEKNKNLSYELAQFKQEKILTSISHMSRHNVNIITVFESGLDIKCMRDVVNSCLAVYKAPVIILSGDDECGYDFVASLYEGRDSREVIDLFKAEAEVKGGGSDKQVQGHVTATASRIKEILSGI